MVVEKNSKTTDPCRRSSQNKRLFFFRGAEPKHKRGVYFPVGKGGLERILLKPV